MRISCTQCRKFVDLPEPIDILGHFVCAECRRAQAEATGVPEPGAVRDPPAALMARRRAAGEAFEPMDEGRPTVPGEVPPELLQMAGAEPAPPAGDDPFALKFTPSQSAAAHPLYEQRPPSTPAMPPRPATSQPLGGAAAPDPQAGRPTPVQAFVPPSFSPASAPPPAAGRPASMPARPQASAPPPIIAVPEPPRSAAGGRAKIVIAAVIAIAAAVTLFMITRPSRPAAEAPPPPTAPAAAPSPTAVAAPPTTTGERSAGGDEFDRVSANDQLNKMAEEAGSCRKPGDPPGVARIQITFEPAGTVKESTVEKGPLYGKPIGKCLAKLFMGARVPPFKGEPVTITKSVVLH